MTEGGAAAESRLERRKAHTRAALIRAAQSFIAAGNLNVPVLEITRAADVGMGSFYNHFESKEQLYRAAVDDALEAHGQYLDHLTEGLEDPAETFARSFRLTGRLFRRAPELSRVLLNNSPALITANRGLAPRALRDIEAATAAGRFTVRDPELALVLTAGALMGLGQLLQERPDRDAADATDALAEDLLRTLGLSPDEARSISSRALPDLDTLEWGGTAA
ncbi:TetR/AcrR family transcriptional regulator [Rhodococcus daqingensis]|uniref:TetR/AcrR family transcriptional regulator n=1 Tax=Rhodococcus daqingensis TaxID=2479363 RepID=A0ABW2RX80_9NOCA